MYRQNYAKRIRQAIRLIIAVSVCISAPAAAFIPIDRYVPDCNTILDVNVLMHRVHDAHWKINYGFSEKCNHEYHTNPSSELAILERMMEIALRTWLQPLREMETKQPIVDSFSFKLTELETWEELTTEGVDLVDIQFNCSDHPFVSYARLKKDRRAAVMIGLSYTSSVGTIGDRFMWTLVHEMGHAFGLADTYNKDDRVRGLTVGMQPPSLMAFSYDHLDDVRVPTGLDRDTIAAFAKKCLTEDDTNGIVWLYRVFYENQPITDCSFSDYTFEEDTGGFRPKAPLFFGIEQGSQRYLSQIIEDNPNMDINVRDGSDRTVLDYAVINEYPDVLCKLLSCPDIKVNAKNNAGQTPLHLAVSNDYLVGVETLLKHTDLNVNAADKQGRTPLHRAAQAGAVASVRALLQHPEIMINAEDNIGFAASDYAGKYYVDHNDRRVFDALIKGKDNAKVDIVATPPPEGMVLIPAGKFLIGSRDPGSESKEQPVRIVYVDAFYMDKTEVTNAQFKEFLIENPSWQKGQVEARFAGRRYLDLWNGNDYPSGKDNHPVVHVSWYAAMAYAQWAGKRLPTEAEWERAARGGLWGKRYPWGNRITPQDANYHFDIDVVFDTTTVGRYPANAYGLYDMAGNVWEWCLDRYDADFYATFPRNGVALNPKGGSRSIEWLINKFRYVGSSRVQRGGSCLSHANGVRVAYRAYGSPPGAYYYIGFRCVKDVVP